MGSNGRMSKFGDYLQRELEVRDWPQAELSRRSGMSRAMVSEVISNNRQPGWDFCAGIATALNKSPVEMFQLAGLLTGGGALDPAIAKYYAGSMSEDERHLLELYRKVPPEGRAWVIKFVAGAVSVAVE